MLDVYTQLTNQRFIKLDIHAASGVGIFMLSRVVNVMYGGILDGHRVLYSIYIAYIYINNPGAVSAREECRL